MNKVIAAGLSFLCLALLALLLRAESSAEEASGKTEPYKMVAPLEVIMEVADTMFYDIDEKLLKTKKFRTIRKHALFLAEIANITKHVEKIEPADKKKEWKAFAEKNVQDLVSLAKAGKAKDEKEVKALWTKVEQTCDSCHEVFRDE